MLNVSDAVNLGWDAATLSGRVEVGGVTGTGRHHAEPATISILTGGKLYPYGLRLLIASPSPDVALLPSILGRDILNRWDMSYRPSRGRLTFDIVTADEVIHVT